MAITDSTLRKLMRETLPGGPPIQLPPDQVEPFLDALRADLERVPGLQIIPDTRRFGYGQKDLSGLSVGYSGRCSHFQCLWHVIVEASGLVNVALGHYSPTELQPVPSREAIFALADRTAQRVERDHALRARREKVKHLQALTIVAALRRFAQEDGFVFHARARSTLLEVTIELRPGAFLDLRIRFTQFEEQLPRLRAIIQSLRELHAHGIRFGITSRPVGGATWTNAGDPKK